MRRWTWWLVSALALWTPCLGLAAAGGIQPPSAPGLAALTSLGPAREDPKREWTILYYLDGDNNLETMYVNTFHAIEQFLQQFPKIQERVEVIVLFDRSRSHDVRDGNWTESRVYRMRPGVGRSELLANCGELNMGDPATLQSFLISAARAFPARRYTVILDDHGAGWHDCANDEDAPGAPSGTDELSLPELHSALSASLQAIGRKNFDILIFDMCLMGQIEVAYACKDDAQAIIFSEASVNTTLMWKAVLSCAFEEENLDTREIARRAIPRWGSFHTVAKQLHNTATLSAIDCSKLDDLLNGFNALLAKMIPAAPQHWATYCRALYYADDYTPPTDRLRMGSRARVSIDLLGAIGRMRANISDFPAEAEYQQFLATARQCILASFAGFAYRRSAGLAIYAPLYSANYNRSGYADQALARATAWPQFLDTLYAMQAQHREKPRLHSSRIQDMKGQLSNTVTPLFGHWCYYVLEATNLLGSDVSLGTEFEGVGYIIWHKTRQRAPRLTQVWRDLPPDELALRMPAYRGGKSILAQELPGVMFQLASGGKTAYATVEELEGGEQAVVQGFYAHPTEGREVEVAIVFDIIRWTGGEAHTLEPTGPGGPRVGRPMPLPPGGVFRPNLLIVDPVAETSRRLPGTPIPWGQGPRLVMSLVPPGEQVLIIEAQTLTGQRTMTGISFKCRPNTFIQEQLQKGQPLTPQMLTGTWQWQRRRINPQTQKGEFQNWGVQVVFGPPDPRDPAAMTYQLISAEKKSSGTARLQAEGLPILSLYSQDAFGNIQREFTFVALYRPEGATPALLLKELSAADYCRFVKE